MAQYSAGKETRKIILDSCRELFYEKGYEATTYDDICAHAHVNRGSIHYHFKSKDAIRKLIAYDAVIGNNQVIEKYLPESKYHLLLASSLFYYKYLKDPKYRRFFYLGDQMNDIFWDDIEEVFLFLWDVFGKNIQYMNFYGFVEDHRFDLHLVNQLDSFLMKILAQNPDQYTYKQATYYFINSTAKLFCIPQDVSHRVWLEIEEQMGCIPYDEIEIRL